MANWKLFLVDAFPQFVLSWLVYGLGFQLETFVFFKANPLKPWEIYSIYAVVFFFIFKNVLPKFITFGGARRHYNDVKSVEKKGLRKFMTKNYIRLFLHILSGATQVLLSGLYVMSPHSFNAYFSFSFLKGWFIFWDTIHETTGWLMTRNHDGIFAIRAFNLAFMVVKLLFCGQIFYMDSMNEDFITLVGGLFILTSGFAWVRFTCSIIAIAQCTFYQIDMTLLRENWYSFGLWTGQYAIAWRCHVLGHMHLVFFLCAIYFPIELWLKERTHFKYENIFVTSILAISYFVRTNNHEIQLVLGLLYLAYSAYFCGPYWKRAPIPGVDYDDKANKAEIKRRNLRRSESYRGVLPEAVSSFISGKKAKRATEYKQTYDDFIATRSSSRASGRVTSRAEQSVLDTLLTAESKGLTAEQTAVLILKKLKQKSSKSSTATELPRHPMAAFESRSNTPRPFFVSRTASRTPSTRKHFHY